MKHKRDMAIADTVAWMNGVYVNNAIGAAFNKQHKYPKQAMLFARAEREKAEPPVNIPHVDIFKGWAAVYNKHHNFTGKGVIGNDA